MTATSTASQRRFSPSSRINSSKPKATCATPHAKKYKRFNSDDKWRNSGRIVSWGNAESCVAAWGVGCARIRSTVAKFCVATNASKIVPVNQTPRRKAANDLIDEKNRLE